MDAKSADGEEERTTEKDEAPLVLDDVMVTVAAEAVTWVSTTVGAGLFALPVAVCVATAGCVFFTYTSLGRLCVAQPLVAAELAVGGVDVGVRAVVTGLAAVAVVDAADAANVAAAVLVAACAPTAPVVAIAEAEVAGLFGTVPVAVVAMVGVVSEDVAVEPDVVAAADDAPAVAVYVDAPCVVVLAMVAASVVTEATLLVDAVVTGVALAAFVRSNAAVVDGAASMGGAVPQLPHSTGHFSLKMSLIKPMPRHAARFSSAQPGTSAHVLAAVCVCICVGLVAGWVEPSVGMSVVVRAAGAVRHAVKAVWQGCAALGDRQIPWSFLQYPDPMRHPVQSVAGWLLLDAGAVAVVVGVVGAASLFAWPILREIRVAVGVEVGVVTAVGAVLVVCVVLRVVMIEMLVAVGLVSGVVGVVDAAPMELLLVAVGVVVGVGSATCVVSVVSDDVRGPAILEVVATVSVSVVVGVAAAEELLVAVGVVVGVVSVGCVASRVVVRGGVEREATVGPASVTCNKPMLVVGVLVGVVATRVGAGGKLLPSVAWTAMRNSCVVTVVRTTAPDIVKTVRLSSPVALFDTTVRVQRVHVCRSSVRSWHGTTCYPQANR